MGIKWIYKYARTSAMFTDGDLPNFHEVDEGELYRGAAPTEKGVGRLSKMGVKTIITLMDDHLDKIDRISKAAAYFNIIHHVIPVSDKVPPTDIQIRRFFDIVNQTVEPVFVHCNGGRHRTGIFVAMYRCLVDNWSKEDAWKEAESSSKGFYSEKGHDPLKKYFVESFHADDYLLGLPTSFK